MSNSPNIGGTSIWAEILRPDVEAANESSVAQRLGMAPETLRGQLRDNRSPNFDFVAAAFPSMAQATQDRLLQAITRRTDLRFYRVDPGEAGEPLVLATRVLHLQCRVFELLSSIQPPLLEILKILIPEQRRNLDTLDVVLSQPKRERRSR